MNRPEGFQGNLRALVLSAAAAGLVFGMTGFASAQTCADAADCYAKKNTKRGDVMRASTKLKECLSNNQKVPPYDRSAVPNAYLNVVGEQDAREKPEIKQAGSDNAKLAAVHRKSLTAYTEALADAQEKIKHYQCDAPVAATKATPTTTTTTTATTPAPTAPTAAPAAGAPKGILITGAAYGSNCPANKQSATVMNHISQACNGRDTCAYRVDHGAIGDSAPGCAKGYEVQWSCAGQANKRSEAAEASGKTLTLACAAAPVAQQPQPQPTQQAQPKPAAPAAAPAAAAGSCNIDMSKATKGWDCRQVAGGWEAKKDWQTLVHPCPTKEAMDAVIKKGDVNTCSALVVQTGDLINAQVAGYKNPIVSNAKAANEAAAKNAAFASRTGANKAFWVDFDNKNKECSGTGYNMGRLKQWCEDGLKPATARLVGAIGKCPSATAVCTIP